MPADGEVRAVLPAHHGQPSAIISDRTGCPDGLCVARKTVENFVARAIRLYEQEPGEACTSARLGSYVQRWLRWTTGGLRTNTRRRGFIKQRTYHCGNLNDDVRSHATLGFTDRRYLESSR